MCQGSVAPGCLTTGTSLVELPALHGVGALAAASLQGEPSGDPSAISSGTRHQQRSLWLCWGQPLTWAVPSSAPTADTGVEFPPFCNVSLQLVNHPAACQPSRQLTRCLRQSHGCQWLPPTHVVMALGTPVINKALGRFGDSCQTCWCHGTSI